MNPRADLLAGVVHEEICGCNAGYRTHGDTYKQVGQALDAALAQEEPPAPPWVQEIAASGLPEDGTA